jgi:RES domain-containing protein
MRVYRITTAQWSNKLQASGNVARWNTRGSFVIYTAGSRALACLENLVHRSGEMSGKQYKVMLIEVPDSVYIDEILVGSLNNDWKNLTNYSYCQSIGANWLGGGKSAVLKVPSIIIEQEHNYLINPQHADFKFINLEGVEDFGFDARF